jgi:allantoin racemase
MKLWYQSLARQTESTPYGEILRATIAAAVDLGTTVELRGVSQAAGIGVHYRFLEHHDMREVMFNAMQAEREGYDAFLIGNISDAGIREARECVNIPVLGLCETSLHVSSIMGASFGLVTISPKWNLRILENVQRYGLERRFAGMEPMNTSPIELKRAMIDLPFRQGIIGQFNVAAKKLLDKGAEIIIPAGGDIIVFLAESHTYEIERAPIVNGIVELVKMGEMAVKLRRITGRFTSKRLSYAPPTGDYLERTRAFYGKDVYPDPEPDR